MFHSDDNENVNENGSEESIPFSEYKNNRNLIDNLTDVKSLNPSKVLNDIHRMNSNRLVIPQLSINSLRNKFTSYSTMIKDNVDIINIRN